MPPEPHPFDDYAVLIDVIRAHLDAIGGFIDTYPNIDASPEERERLVDVELRLGGKFGLARDAQRWWYATAPPRPDRSPPPRAETYPQARRVPPRRQNDRLGGGLGRLARLVVLPLCSGVRRLACITDGLTVGAMTLASRRRSTLLGSRPTDDTRTRTMLGAPSALILSGAH